MLKSLVFLNLFILVQVSETIILSTWSWSYCPDNCDNYPCDSVEKLIDFFYLLVLTISNINKRIFFICLGTHLLLFISTLYDPVILMIPYVLCNNFHD
jgi:hypothetical protein